MGHEIALYAEDDIAVFDWLTINPGIRVALFLIDSRAYLSPEPRFSAKVDFGRGWSMKASYSAMSQYVHLLSATTISLPLDLWVPITKDIPPVESDQYSLGAFYTGLPGWEFSLEAYYKSMRNILEYKDGMNFLGNSQDWDETVAVGIGRAYGAELFIQKTSGKTTGWLGYTLAKSERRFPDGSVSGGDWFPYRYDRRHNISLVVNRQLGKRWDVSATWTFATGNWMTLPERETIVLTPDGSFMEINYIPRRNNYLLPASHRLNLGINFHKQKKRGEAVWNFSLYNVYNNMNPNFALYYGDDELEVITLLPIIPSFNYAFKF